MLKAVIFDMDGLMIDSEVVFYGGSSEFLEKLGYHQTLEFYKKTLGTTARTSSKMYKDEYSQDLDFDALLKYVHEYMDYTFETKGVPLKKGLIELLTYLKENGYKTIVATSSYRHRVNKIFDKADLHKYFDDYICGDEVTNGKPDPEIFIKACKKLNVDTTEALVLEDSEMGIQAAYSAHIPVICIPDMKEPAGEYKKMCTCIFESLDNVIDYIGGMDNEV